MKKMRKNNKGFSLVELIVVIAIMAILAVTLAPRLSQYVEKSRKAADGEVVNAIMTATRLGVLEEDIQDAFNAALENGVVPGTVDLVADDYYATTDGVTFTKGTATDDFATQLQEIVGEFKLKSNETETATTIKIVYDESAKTITVGLYYDGSTIGYNVSDRYEK